MRETLREMRLPNALLSSMRGPRSGSRGPNLTSECAKWSFARRFSRRKAPQTCPNDEPARASARCRRARPKPEAARERTSEIQARRNRPTEYVLHVSIRSGGCQAMRQELVDPRRRMCIDAEKHIAGLLGPRFGDVSDGVFRMGQNPVFFRWVWKTWRFQTVEVVPNLAGGDARS